MKSGFELWNYLQKKHFKRAKYINKSKPVSKIHLIEVHPTIIFKKLQNSKEANSKKWIGCREPINKKRSVGKKQRREKLHLLFPNQKSVIENLKIDYIDALIAAYTAEQALKGNAIAFGDPGEGQIWFPNR
jgi:predicted nuclease with RNAse H fold